MERQKLFSILRRVPAPLLMAAIWVLSSFSTLPKPPGPFGIDKIQHFLAYGCLAAFVSLWFRRECWDRNFVRTGFFVLLITSAYGAIDEVHQHFVPGRSCDFRDWLADTLGAALAVGLIGLAGLMTLRRKTRQRHPEDR